MLWIVLYVNVFILLSYTISVVVVKHEFDRWLYPHKWVVNFLLTLLRGVKSIFLSLMFGRVEPKIISRPADHAYWHPPTSMIKKLVPAMFIQLRTNGYAKSDYRKDQHDCDDYELAGRHILHDLLVEETKDIPEAKEKAFAIRPFSFSRDDGKRHRLFYVEDDEGARHFVESWPVFDKFHDKSGMYRILSIDEELNGYSPS